MQPRLDFFPHVEGRLDLDLDSLCAGLVVADVIPNPPRTQLIRDSEARGCILLDGLGMLVSQGAISIRHWTGIEPELQVMRTELEHIFGVNPTFSTRRQNGQFSGRIRLPRRLNKGTGSQKCLWARPSHFPAGNL
jgi:hypothetical protein